ncbi:hypothetical protein Tco_0040865, partial [Tanacetum coccineum]
GKGSGGGGKGLTMVELGLWDKRGQRDPLIVVDGWKGRNADIKDGVSVK